MDIEETNLRKILNDIISIIKKTKNLVAIQANSSLTVMFWHIGKRIQTEILQDKRAQYGKQIVVTLSRELSEKFGNNFEEKNLRRMIQFSV